jgi:hypothetical protein
MSDSEFSHLLGYKIPRTSKYGRTIDISVFSDQSTENSGEGSNVRDNSTPEMSSPDTVNNLTDSSNQPVVSPFALPMSKEEAKELFLAETGLKTGRPSKLTPERHKFIIDHIRTGVPAKVACGLAGVHENASTNWVVKGREDIQRDIDSIYARFAIDMIIAQSELEAKLARKWAKIVSEPTTKRKQIFREQLITKEDGTVETVRYLESDTIELTGDGDWRGIAEFMSRRYPDRWKRTERLEQTGPDGGPIQIMQASIDVDKMSAEARELLWKEIKQIQGNVEEEMGKERETEEEMV